MFKLRLLYLLVPCFLVAASIFFTPDSIAEDKGIDAVDFPVADSLWAGIDGVKLKVKADALGKLNEKGEEIGIIEFFDDNTWTYAWFPELQDPLMRGMYTQSSKGKIDLQVSPETAKSFIEDLLDVLVFPYDRSPLVEVDITKVKCEFKMKVSCFSRNPTIGGLK